MTLQCDEERPECTRCRKAGRRCPGYRKEMILKHYNAGGSRTNTFKLSPEQKDHTVRQKSSDRSTGPVLLAAESPSLSSIYANQAVSTLVVAISPEWQVLLPSQRYTRIWLQEVIHRANNDALLHHSARALSLLYLGITTGARDVLLAAQSSYTSALKKMQSAISHRDQALTNVQSAAMLLTFFEVKI